MLALVSIRVRNRSSFSRRRCSARRATVTSVTTMPTPGRPPCWAGNGKKPKRKSRSAPPPLRAGKVTRTSGTDRPRSMTSCSRGSSSARASGSTSHTLRPTSESSARSLSVAIARFMCRTRRSGSRKPSPIGALSSTLPSKAALARSARRRRTATVPTATIAPTSAKAEPPPSSGASAASDRAVFSIRLWAAACSAATWTRTASIETLPSPDRISARAASGPSVLRERTTSRANARLRATNAVRCSRPPAGRLTASMAASSVSSAT